MVRDSISSVEALIRKSGVTIACVAPSFAAEFNEMDYQTFVAMIKALGFDRVVEVAFGADLVSIHYNHLVNVHRDDQFIATTCPAIVAYVEKYHPGLVKDLAPIASPMIATSRMLRKMYGDDVNIVFIGPCIAKKDEANREDIRDEIQEVLTYSELRDMFTRHDITPDLVAPLEFDPPHPGKGTLYPIGRGMLESADLHEDLMTNRVFATDGTKQFTHTLKEFESLKHEIRLLELLCCNGCIMGPGITTNQTHFSRRTSVSRYAQDRYKNLDLEKWQQNIEHYRDLDLHVNFAENDLRYPIPTREELQNILYTKGKFNPEDELNCGACGYDTCLEHAIAIYMGMAESEMCLPYTIETLRDTASELKESYEELVHANNALVQSEKLASLGRLASGVAHEINNPLTAVLTYSSLMLEEMKETEFSDDLGMIVTETLRCREIVKGLLDFARESKNEKEMYNINDIIGKVLKLSEKHFALQKITLIKLMSDQVPACMMDVNQMTSLVNNLLENAAHACPDGGLIGISTEYKKKDDVIILEISDTGCGINADDLDKIYDPFYTTKKAGKGTGLGLAVTFGIVKNHNGTIDVSSKVGKGTRFTITIPAYRE